MSARIVLLFFLLLLVNNIIECQDTTFGEVYEDIVSAIGESRNYIFPDDNSQFLPRNEKILDFDKFDFIIIGAGSTGATLAGLLSENPKFKILLLEAGGPGSKLTEVTRMSYDAYIMSDYNWGYYSIPQKTACLGMKGGKCAHPRGKGMGGTSLLNALIYVRGNRRDFDLWCQMGNPGWCYEDVLPYFLKSENLRVNLDSAPVDKEYHSTGGPWNVEFPNPISPQTKVFMEASEDLGYNYTDVNGASQIGHMPFQINTKYGRRQDSATTFINPVKDKRKNLVILTNAYATKILINRRKEAYGVLFTYNGVLYRAIAKKEVICSAGAINGPQLLMLSGIGPRNHLSRLGIKTIQDLEVGSHFSDHLQIYGLSFTSNLSEPVKTMKENIVDFLNGKGFYAEALSSQAVGYYATKMARYSDYPDIEISFFDANTTTYALSTFQKWMPEVTEAMGERKYSSDFGVFVTPLHTKSRGTVRLKSASPYDFPLIDPNCMSDPEGHDIKLALEGIKFALKFAETKAFKSINATVNIKPLKYCSQHEFLTDNYWMCLIRYISAHNNHPVSTCKMGPHPAKGDVVDYKLRVHGIKRLRVADASVIPLSTSSHINAMCVMIGAKLADMLKIQYGR